MTPAGKGGFTEQVIDDFVFEARGSDVRVQPSSEHAPMTDLSLNRGERCQAVNIHLHFADSGVRVIKVKPGRFPVSLGKKENKTKQRRIPQN